MPIDDMRDCIDNCTECAAICMEAISHCLSKGGKHAAASHISLVQDCADICATSANFMLRGSERHKLTCGVCAEICAECAKSCESMADDEMMQRCAEACRRCAVSCRDMSGGTRKAA